MHDGYNVLDKSFRCGVLIKIGKDAHMLAISFSTSRNFIPKMISVKSKNRRLVIDMYSLDNELEKPCNISVDHTSKNQPDSLI